MATLTLNNAYISMVLLPGSEDDDYLPVAGWHCHVCRVDLPLTPLTLHGSPEAWLTVLFHVATEHPALLADVFLGGRYVDSRGRS